MLGLGSITDVPPDTWRQTMAVNLDAVFYLLRSGLPAMKARGGGSVVIGGSIAALKAFPNHAAYCASKGALLALVRQAAIDYGPDIRINVLCPGPVDTPLIWDLGGGVSRSGARRVRRRAEDAPEAARIT
ncbi:MAG: SDR family oxidoreductase [Comamonadaceae bacterium]|nr:SDR family oxidoreductase [Comamonadaceae bacterium]